MPDRYRIIFVPEASKDLEEIYRYIGTRSPQNATSVARRLVEAIDSLDQLPQRYDVHKSSRNPDWIVRGMSVPPFIIYYRIVERHLAVHVLSLRHGARRQPKRFK